MKRVFKEEEEKIIYTLIKEYTKKKPIIEIKSLIHFMNNRLKLNQDFNKNKIELILKKFIGNQIILVGKKLVKEDILETPIRNTINNLIINNPGININQIMNELNIGANRVLWHLELLMNFKYIRSIKIESQKVFFSFNSDAKYDLLFFFLRNDKVIKILEFLKQKEEPLRPTIIAESLSMHYNTVKKYLITLVSLNLVLKVNGNKKKRYLINKENLEKILIMLDNIHIS